MKKQLLLSVILFAVFALVQLHAANTDSYNWLHAKAFNGMNATGMTVDKSNNTYLYGFSHHDIKYGVSTTAVDYLEDRTSVFVIKLNAQNEYQWTKKIHVEKSGETGSSLNVRSMDVDDDGNMYFGGDFSGAIVVNSQTYNAPSYGYFIMKTNSAGTIQWFQASESSGSVHRVKYTGGRIGFVCGLVQSTQLFGTDLLTKFGSLQNFSDCDMMVGALSVTDGAITFAQGIKTGFTYTLQQLNLNSLMSQNILDADNSGNLYLTAGFKTGVLKVAGVNYEIESGMEATESQFVLRVGTFGEISWVKIISNAKGTYPTLAVNNASGVAVLFNGGNNSMKIGSQTINVQGDASKMNHIALFSLSGDLLKTTMLNGITRAITPSSNGAFCVAGNLTSDGQYFGIDGLYNGESLKENLFVGFFDRNLNGLGGQAVISEGMYMPSSLKTGVDGKIRLLGNINFEATSSNVTYPFGNFVVPRPEGDNKMVFSVLDPKQIIKAEIMSYGIGCGRYSININPSVKSKVQWYVNNVAKGTDFSLMGEDNQGGYSFGTHYIKAVLTDSTDATNTAEFKDTITVYNPVVNINTEINPQTGVVNYSVVVSNYAPTYNLYVDRGNYDSSTEPNGTYTYSPGTHTIKVSLSEKSNMNCNYNIEKSFVVPEPKTTQECNQGVIKGKVESALATFMAGEVRVELIGIANAGNGLFIHIPLKSDTIDANGEFKFENLSELNYKIRANIIDPSKYPTLLVTYFNNVVNQITSWQDASQITLGCNQWADLNLTFAAINAVMNGTGSISGIISYSDAPTGAPGKASVKASSKVGEILMSNVPVILRRKSNHEIVARTITDANGIYTFENLIEDEYEIVVEIPGVAMATTYDVAITQSADNVENRNFIVTNAGINTTTQLAVVATSTGNGTISPTGTTMLNAGEGKSYSIAAASGSFIQDVLVNGVSVGVVSNYNFTNINANQTIHAIFNLNTGLNADMNSKTSVFPVLFNNNVFVKGLNSRNKVLLINQLGVVQFVSADINSSELTINTSELSAGIYFIQIVSENSSVETHKLIKK